MGFVVDSSGCLVTNKVIERAYMINKQRLATRAADPRRKISLRTGAVEGTSTRPSRISWDYRRVVQINDHRRSFRVNSATNYQLCRIVDVQARIGVAVLRRLWLKRC
jgi:hypothetical protein